MQAVKLKNIGKIITGNTPSKKTKEYYSSNDIPFIKPTSFNKKQIVSINSSDEYLSTIGSEKGRLVEKGTVLVTCIGEIGNVGIVQNPVCFNQQINAIEPNMEICLPEYLAYSLFNIKQHIKDLANAPVVPIINKSQFSEIQIPLPQLPTQRKIVEVLDKAQSLIDKRKEQIELLDKLIQSTFYDMFGDPVKNDMGWEEGTIRQLCDEVKYGTSKKANEHKGNYEILRMNNITYKGFWDFGDLKYVDLQDKEIEKYTCKKNDLLFNRTNSKELVGKTAVYNLNKHMAIAGYLIRVRTNALASPYYIWAYLNSYHGKLILNNMCKNIVGMANINAQELQNIKINIPPVDLQNQFAQKVEKIEQQKELLNQSLKLMEDNFNSLMQRAFRGEIV